MDTTHLLHLEDPTPTPVRRTLPALVQDVAAGALNRAAATLAGVAASVALLVGAVLGVAP